MVWWIVEGYPEGIQFSNFPSTNWITRLLKIEYEQQNDPWNVERFLEDLLLVVKGQSNLDIDGYL